MLELKELDEYLIYFPLLKSQEKLYAQDMIWKGICKILRWQFIPSVQGIGRAGRDGEKARYTCCTMIVTMLCYVEC